MYRNMFSLNELNVAEINNVVGYVLRETNAYVSINTASGKLICFHATLKMCQEMLTYRLES